MTKQKNQQKTPKSNTKKWWLLGIGLAGIGTLSFFGWRYYKSQQRNPMAEMPNIDTSNPAEMPSSKSTAPKAKSTKAKTTKQVPTSQPSNTPTPKTKSVFPLKKGSKNEQVKALQNALIAKYGNTILPRYGADGGFGAELLAALKKLSLPESINESTYNVLVKGSAPNSTATAKQFYDALVAKSFDKTLKCLKTLRNTNDYSIVSKAFSNYRISSVRQTLVNALLNAFTSEDQKQAIRMELLRVGLSYDGSKWALSGLESPLLITTCATQVWKDPKTPINVPINMVLGTSIDTRNGYSLFENEGNQFLVKTQHIRLYK